MPRIGPTKKGILLLALTYEPLRPKYRSFLEKKVIWNIAGTKAK